MATTTRKRPAGRRTAAQRAASARNATAGRKSGTSAPQNRGEHHAGIFITLEGGEGSGKSTQMQLIADWLEKMGHTVVKTREPGGSAGAEAVRHVLLSGAAEALGTEMEAILFAAARADHVDAVIKPALERGDVVLSDRFYDSTRVYQGVSGKASPEVVRRLERVACGTTWPDLTIIIDVKPEEGMKRAGKRRTANEDPDRFEKESLELQQLRREAYLQIAKEEPGRCVTVSGAGKPETVFQRIRKQIEKRFGDRIADRQNGQPENVDAEKPDKPGSRTKPASRKQLGRKRKKPSGAGADS